MRVQEVASAWSALLVVVVAVAAAAEAEAVTAAAVATLSRAGLWVGIQTLVPPVEVPVHAHLSTHRHWTGAFWLAQRQAL